MKQTFKLSRSELHDILNKMDHNTGYNNSQFFVDVVVESGVMTIKQPNHYSECVPNLLLEKTGIIKRF